MPVKHPTKSSISIFLVGLVISVACFFYVKSNNKNSAYQRYADEFKQGLIDADEKLSASENNQVFSLNLQTGDADYVVFAPAYATKDSIMAANFIERSAKEDIFREKERLEEECVIFWVKDSRLINFKPITVGVPHSFQLKVWNARTHPKILVDLKKVRFEKNSFEELIFSDRKERNS